MSSAAANTTSDAKKKVVTVTDPKIDAIVIEKLITARIGLLLKAPFFGNLATRLQLVNADEWCPTAATDGRKFYYNSEFVNKLSTKETEFLFGHETLHNVYDHMGRRDSRDPQLFNIAADYCVNGDLIEQRIGEKITKVQILHDLKYKGWSAEEVYDDLYENAEKIDMQKLIDQMLDQHLDGSGEDGQPELSDEDKKAIRDELREAMLNAAEAAGAGNVPSGVKRMLADLTAPKMNWRELLAQQIESTIKSDYTWMRPSRRSWHMDAILPGTKVGEMIDICVSIDMSGSITSAQCKDFFSEIKGIMDMYTEFRIHVFTFDTAVYNAQVFTQDNMDDILHYEPLGGGGTDFTCVWDFLKAENIEPKKLVFFTDMYPSGSWGDPEYCDTVWIAHGTTTIVAPFGITAYYDLAGVK